MLLALGYDRDKTGLITDITESRPAGEQSGAWHYGYDTLKRLSGATWTPSAGAATAYGYTYDRNGNRLSESVTGSATKFSRYNKLDQLLDERTSAAYPGGTIEKSYAWDKHGRLSSESGVGVSPAIDRLYTWSVDDRLESVQLGTNPSDPTVRYTYDHEGRLIKREKGQDVARYLVDNDNPTGYSQALAEVNADATKTTENYYYGDDFGPLAQVHNPGASGFDQRFLYGDHLSTTRLLTTGLSSDQYSHYSPYGAVTQPAGGSSLTSHAFTGQSRDLDTGLQYHRARWLSTSQGRWLSMDPVWDIGGNTAKPFSYCVVGGPSNGRDPSGMANDSISLTTVAAIIGTLTLGFALLGFALGGPKGALYGGLFGLGAGIALVAVVRGFPGKAALLLLGLWAALLWYAYVHSLPKKKIPIALPYGFQTARGGNVGKALIVFPWDRIHPALGQNEFGEIKLTAAAQILFENGYTVTYGRPGSKEDLDDQLYTREYDFIYILGHGAQAGSGGKGIKVIEGGDWASVDDDTYLMIQDLSRLVGEPKFVFLDGCDLDNISGVKGQAIAHTTQNYGGIPATTLNGFLVVLFGPQHQGKVKESFESVYNNPAIVENPQIFKLQNDATLPTKSKGSPP